jgi:hypothetical protein
MSYVISAEEYFGQLNESERSQNLIVEYFKQVPEAFWASLDAFNPNDLITCDPVREASSYSEDQLEESSQYLLSNYEDLSILQRDRVFLEGAGYDVVELTLTKTYFEKLSALDESVLGTTGDVITSVGKFLKSMVVGDSPMDTAVNVIRLLLDLAGALPTVLWASVGLPGADIAANLLSALLSLFAKKEPDYLSAVLSILAMLPGGAVMKLLGPLGKVLNPLIKILCRPSSLPAERAAAAMLAKSSIIKSGQKGLMPMVEQFFIKAGDALAGFIPNLITKMVKAIGKILEYVPFLGGAGAKLIKWADAMALTIASWGKNFKEIGEEIAKTGEGTLKQSADSATGAAISNAEKQLAAATPGLANVKLSDAIKKQIGDKFQGSEEVIKDLTKEIQSDEVYKKVADLVGTGKLGQDVLDKVTNAAIINKLAVSSIETATKNKAIQALLKTSGRSSNQLVKLAKAGDVSSVKALFTEILSDPNTLKSLSKNEVKALNVFKANPELFTKGVKNMAATDIFIKKVLTTAAPVIAKRVPVFKRMIAFITAMYWKKLGSLDCIVKAGMAKAANLSTVVSATNALSTGAPALANEDMIAEEATQTTLDSLKTINPELYDQVQAELAKSDSATKKYQATANKDGKAEEADPCQQKATLVQALGGNHVSSTGSLGGTSLMGNDPNKSKEFLDKSTDYSKGALEVVGGDTAIDVQHALDQADPVTQAYFSDAWDSKTGTASLNTEDKSRMDDYVQDMVKRGIIKPEEAEGIKAKARALIDNGQEPKIDVNVPTNESLFAIKPFSFIK